MPSQFTRVGRGFQGGDFLKLPGLIQEFVANELEDVGADGLLEAQSIVESSGTGSEWSGPFRDRDGTIRSGPGQGRIASGKMLRALEYRIYRGKNVGLDVGWLHIWEEYFGAQDEGFEAGGYRANKKIQGMGVIAHMRTYLRDRVDTAIDRGVRKALDAI